MYASDGGMCRSRQESSGESLPDWVTVGFGERSYTPAPMLCYDVCSQATGMRRLDSLLFKALECTHSLVHFPSIPHRPRSWFHGLIVTSISHTLCWGLLYSFRVLYFPESSLLLSQLIRIRKGGHATPRQVRPGPRRGPQESNLALVFASFGVGPL